MAMATYTKYLTRSNGANIAVKHVNIAEKNNITLVQQLHITNGYVGTIKCKNQLRTTKKINLACRLRRCSPVILMPIYLTGSNQTNRILWINFGGVCVEYTIRNLKIISHVLLNIHALQNRHERVYV